jgi:transposase-like protein
MKKHWQNKEILSTMERKQKNDEISYTEGTFTKKTESRIIR